MSRKKQEQEPIEEAGAGEEAATAVAETVPSAEEVAREETEDAEGSSETEEPIECTFAFEVGARLVVKDAPTMALKVLEQVSTANGPCYVAEVHDPRCASAYQEQFPESSLEAVAVVEPEA